MIFLEKEKGGAVRKHIASLLVLAIAMNLFWGCGTKKEPEESAQAQASEEAAAADTAAPAGSAETEPSPEEKVLNIYTIGEDFKNRVQDFYPDYEKVEEDSGLIGLQRVQWHVFTDEQEYLDALDEVLAMQVDPESGAAVEDIDQNEKIDMFVVSENFLKDYVESGFSADIITDVGLSSEELADQFLYTKQMATDSTGRLKAVTWQATPGVFAYRRSIAQEVLGTDVPEEVQQYVSDWEVFEETAQTMKDSGYYMLSGYGDAYQVYADNVTSAWVEDGALNIDPHLEDWAVQTREFAQSGFTHGTEQWGDEWKADHASDGKVFGFFYSSWGIHYTLQSKAEGEEDSDSQSAAGDYAVCLGPEPSHYGGQWVIAAAGSDDMELSAEIMRKLTCDPALMKKITLDIREFTNTVSGMTELAQSDYSAEVLGGQNPIPVYVESAGRLNKAHTTVYDNDLDTGFQVTMQDYFAGRVSEIDALETFRKVALSRYEELQDIAEDDEE